MKKPTGKKTPPAVPPAPAVSAAAFGRVSQQSQILSLLATAHENEIKRLRDELIAISTRLGIVEARANDEADRSIWQRLFGKRRT